MDDMTVEQPIDDMADNTGRENLLEPDESSQNIISEPDMKDDARRPSDLPEKFWDEDRQEIRADALANSYIALERKFGGMEPACKTQSNNGPQKRLRIAVVAE